MPYGALVHRNIGKELTLEVGTSLATKADARWEPSQFRLEKVCLVIYLFALAQLTFRMHEQAFTVTAYVYGDLQTPALAAGM